MRMRQKLSTLFNVMFGLVGLFGVTWIISLLPYTAAIEPELPTAWQKFVEFAIDVVQVANDNIALIAILLVAIFGGGYLAISKTSKR